jgi:hypothetical protein
VKEIKIGMKRGSLMLSLSLSLFLRKNASPSIRLELLSPYFVWNNRREVGLIEKMEFVERFSSLSLQNSIREEKETLKE